MALSAWESERFAGLMPPDLQLRVSAGDRLAPSVTGANGTLMARRSWRTDTVARQGSSRALRHSRG